MAALQVLRGERDALLKLIQALRSQMEAMQAQTQAQMQAQGPASSARRSSGYRQSTDYKAAGGTVRDLAALL